MPPFDEGDRSVECAYPVCFIENNLHFPRPHEVWIAGGEPPSVDIVTFQVSMTDSLVTMIGLTILVLIFAFIASRGRALIPGPLQNFTEWVYESLSGFGMGMGGEQAARISRCSRRSSCSSSSSTGAVSCLRWAWRMGCARRRAT